MVAVVRMPRLVGGAMNVEPVFGQAFQPRDLEADFVVENFGAASGNGIQPRITQPDNRVPILSALYSAMAMTSEAE